MFPQKTLIRHSRVGGNPGLRFSGIFKDYRHFKFLDSRMRGNDAVKVAVLIKRLLLIVWIFRRPVDSLKGRLKTPSLPIQPFLHHLRRPDYCSGFVLRFLPFGGRVGVGDDTCAALDV